MWENLSTYERNILQTYINIEAVTTSRDMIKNTKIFQRLELSLQSKWIWATNNTRHYLGLPLSFFFIFFPSLEYEDILCDWTIKYWRVSIAAAFERATL